MHLKQWRCMLHPPCHCMLHSLRRVYHYPSLLLSCCCSSLINLKRFFHVATPQHIVYYSNSIISSCSFKISLMLHNIPSLDESWDGTTWIIVITYFCMWKMFGENVIVFMLKLIIIVEFVCSFIHIKMIY